MYSSPRSPSNAGWHRLRVMVGRVHLKKPSTYLRTAHAPSGSLLRMMLPTRNGHSRPAAARDTSAAVPTHSR